VRRATGLALLVATSAALGLAGPGVGPGAGPARQDLREGATAAADYERRPLRGFDVRAHPDLLAGGASAGVGARALDALERDLAAVAARVPAAAAAKLREVPIYLSVDDPATPCACYHPSAAWLRRNGFDPAKARSVELASAARFLEDRAHQPSLILHELAHALHDLHLGEADDRITAAFEAMRASGAYDDVLRASGHRSRHYALTNAKEYFAETSEAYLGVNDFWPFVRAELDEADPEGARLVAELWGAEPVGAGEPR